MDGAGVKKKRKGSVVFVFLRCVDMHGMYAHKKSSWRCVGVIDGPSEPSTLGHMLYDIAVSFFEKHDPGSKQGMTTMYYPLFFH